MAVLNQSQEYATNVGGGVGVGVGGGGWGVITEYVVMFKHFKVSGITGARCSSVVRAFAHGAMGRRIDPSWGGPMDLFLVPASAPRLV